MIVWLSAQQLYIFLSGKPQKNLFKLKRSFKYSACPLQMHVEIVLTIRQVLNLLLCTRNHHVNEESRLRKININRYLCKHKHP